MAYNFLPHEVSPVGEKIRQPTWDTTMFQMPVNVVSRQGWGALPPKEPEVPMQLPIRIVYYTYSHTDQCKTKRECSEIVRGLQRQHMEAGHNDIYFNFLIGGDGNVYEGAGWDMVKEPSRPEYDNDVKCAIAYIRRGEDDEDDEAEKLIWVGFDFLEWAYPMKYLY